MTKKNLLLVIFLLVIISVTFFWYNNFFLKNKMVFKLGSKAYQEVEKQLSFGPRYIGSEGHSLLVEYLENRLTQAGLQVEKQTFTQSYDGVDYQFVNVIGRDNPLMANRIILGTHYDSRRYADLDPIEPQAPLIGANDSASGTAILLVLADYLEKEKIDLGIDFIFFDGEEGFPGIKKEDWYPLGSKYFVANIHDYYEQNPEVIIIDMVGDKDLQIYVDNNSFHHASELTKNIHRIGNGLFPKVFLNQTKYNMIDDHTAFNNARIPATLLIDFDYPVFHTKKDDLSQISEKSLGQVALVLLQFLKQ